MSILKSIVSSLKGIIKKKNRRKPRRKKKAAGRKMKKRARVSHSGKKSGAGSRLKRTAKKKARRPGQKKKRKVVKKRSVRRPPKKTAGKGKVVKKPDKEAPAGKPFGEITHFFSKISVVVIKVTRGKIARGDELHIRGRSTDFKQRIDSMQIESVDVASARKGQIIGLKVKKPAREGDKVFKI